MTAALLADYTALNDPAQRRRVERRGGYFVVEGALALDALLASRYPVRSVLVTPAKAATVRELVEAHGRRPVVLGPATTSCSPTPGDPTSPGPAALDPTPGGGPATVVSPAGRGRPGERSPRPGEPGDGVPVVVRPEDEVHRVTGFAFHRGVLAAADRLPLPPLDEVVRGAGRLLVVEGLGDHENLGALFRNAAAFGVDGVVLDPTTADPLYRRSVRVSVGHVLRVAWTRAGTWPGPLADLRRRGFTVAALTPAPTALPIDEVALAPPDRLAFLVGAEGPGLTAPALAAADLHVRIPLAPGVDSLNVATAAAIALHRLPGASAV